ncbi:MAG: hypothetical protein ACWA5Q_00370 [bacterium]
MTLPGPFHSTREFRAAFVRGLSDMLGEDDLGTLILVLANATIDCSIEHILHTRLAQRFADFETEYHDQLQPDAVYPEDDLSVFKQLLSVGFDNLKTTQRQKIGAFELQYNQMRSFRPPRMSGKQIESLLQPFDPDGFHFNKPFLHKEIMWQGDLAGRECRLLYNKFPFAELHGLLVMDVEEQRPQYMRGEDHEFVWTLVNALGEGMQGVGFAFNAHGACASINHQHFQMYVRDGGRYPIEHSAWRHRGGGENYPLECTFYDQCDQAWTAIEQLHQRQQTYNLLYRPSGMYLVPRRFQGSYQHESWTPGFAWAEVAGAATAFTTEDYQRLSATDFERELAKLTLPATPGS